MVLQGIKFLCYFEHRFHLNGLCAMVICASIERWINLYFSVIFLLSGLGLEFISSREIYCSYKYIYAAWISHCLHLSLGGIALYVQISIYFIPVYMGCNVS